MVHNQANPPNIDQRVFYFQRGYGGELMFAIRRAIENDQQVILDLWTLLIEYHRSIEAFRPERWKILPEEAIRPLLTAAWEDPKNRAAFVAETEGRALGFVYTELKEAGHCPGNINALFVRGDERTHGAGQALLDAGLKWCRRKGANQVSLDCIWPNDIARRFYEKRGFRPLLITYVLQLESDAETRIRAAVAADVAEVARIVEDAYRHYIPRMGKPPGPMLDDYSARISEEVVWVIEEGMNMVGILVLLPRPGHLLLDNIAVSPSRQGLGLGRRLLDFAEAEALRRGYREIQLYTHETMVENQQLYTAIGYEEIGRGTEKGYARVHMRKQLRA